MYDGTDPSKVAPSCVPYTNLDGGVEFIAPIETATPVGVIDFPATNQDLYDRVADAAADNPGSFVGVHETPTDQAHSIVRGGFDPDRVGEMSVVETGPREDAVFTWQYVWDISGGREDLSGVITTAPRPEVVASNMSASVTKPTDEYIENHTMPYPDFVKCLRSHGPNTVMMLESDLIQDISGYNP